MLDKLYPVTNNPGWRINGKKTERSVMISTMINNFADSVVSDYKAIDEKNFATSYESRKQMLPKISKS